MYICICNAITDKQIQSAIESGADNMRALSKTLGVGNQCGKCACDAKTLLRQHKNKRTSEKIIELTHFLPKLDSEANPAA